MKIGSFLQKRLSSLAELVRSQPQTSAPAPKAPATPRFYGGFDKDVFITPNERVSMPATARVKLKNGRSIADGVYGSGQIKAGDVPELQRLGIDTVVSFRKTGKINRNEEQFLREGGINFVNIQISNRKVPKSNPRSPNGEVKQFLDVLADPKNGNILFHCAKGKGRTGIFHAVARAKELYEKGDPRYMETALAEARKFGFTNKKQINYARDSVNALIRGEIPGHKVEFGSANKPAAAIDAASDVAA